MSPRKQEKLYLKAYAPDREEGNYEFTEDELKAVLALALDVLSWAKAQIK